MILIQKRPAGTQYGFPLGLLLAFFLVGCSASSSLSRLSPDKTDHASISKEKGASPSLTQQQLYDALLIPMALQRGEYDTAVKAVQRYVKATGDKEVAMSAIRFLVRENK
ncbi:MAG: hypothetical protein D6698_13355, partial [Gammaproteobacteria bacterium]